MIKINTTHPFCVDQPDFTIHAENFDPLNFDAENPVKLRPLKLNCSAGQDNHTNNTHCYRHRHHRVGRAKGVDVSSSSSIMPDMAVRCHKTNVNGPALVELG